MVPNKFVHLRTFPLTYEISACGRVRKRTQTGYLYFDHKVEDNGVFVTLEINGAKNKYLVATLIIISFHGPHFMNHAIHYKDGNMLNISIDNLRLKAPLLPKKVGLYNQDEMISVWRCKSKARLANRKYAAKNQSISTEEILRLLMLFDFNCFYCGCGLHPLKWHLDHYVPQSKNGRNQFENLRPACKKCNMMKSDLNYEELIVRAERILFMYKTSHAPLAELVDYKSVLKLA